MDQIRSLSQMIEEARKLCASKGKKRVSVAMAEDAGLISAIEEARRTGLVEATLMGNVEKAPSLFYFLHKKKRLRFSIS